MIIVKLRWRSCWCSVVLPTWLLQGQSKCSCRCLALSASKKDLWGPNFSSFALSSLTFTSFTPRILPFWASSSGFHSFGPHLISSLHFFDPDPNAPDPCLRNICLVTLVVGRVSKRFSRRTYKVNASSMKLGCRAIGGRQSGPENQDQASWIKRLGRLQGGLLWENRKHLKLSEPSWLVGITMIF